MPWAMRSRTERGGEREVAEEKMRAGERKRDD